MARPPRGRLSGSGRPSDETGESELPLGLPRVDPVRPGSQREAPIGSDFDPKIDSAREAAKSAPFVPPMRAAASEPELPPQRLTQERVGDPFDYYAMPKSESDPLKRPTIKPAVFEATEYVTSKYFTPRSDLNARWDVDDDTDQTANWSRSVRPGRPILESSFSTDDDTPPHLRNLPSRVRDHLRTEPSMPQAFEALGSFAQTAPTAMQLRARSGVPLPLAPELRAPIPQDVRMTRHVPDLPAPSLEGEPDIAYQRADEFADPRQHDSRFRDAFHDNARDDFAHAPEFDSASDEAVTYFDPHVPPLVDDLSSFDQADRRPHYSDNHFVDGALRMPTASTYDFPSWGSPAQQVAPPPPVAVSDWDQDQALHALTSRTRDRSVEATNRMNMFRGENILKSVRDAFGFMRAKARDVQEAHRQGKIQKQAIDTTRPHDVRRQADPQFDQDLRASRSDGLAELGAEFMIRPSTAERNEFSELRQGWSFFKMRQRAPVVRVSVGSGRAQLRKRQSRLYEDIVAWIVVPPFIIGLIYGGLELSKFLANSPLGKLLSGD